MKKVYNATLNSPLTKADLQKVRDGLELEDGPVKVNWIEYLSADKKQEISLEISVGRNRIVRRIFEHLGYEVTKLDRVYLGGLTKKDLKRGWWRPLTDQEVIMLKHFSRQA